MSERLVDMSIRDKYEMLLPRARISDDLLMGIDRVATDYLSEACDEEGERLGVYYMNVDAESLILRAFSGASMILDEAHGTDFQERSLVLFSDAVSEIAENSFPDETPISIDHAIGLFGTILSNAKNIHIYVGLTDGAEAMK